MRTLARAVGHPGSRPHRVLHHGGGRLTKADYMRKYRRSERSYLSTQVQIAARRDAMRWAKAEHPDIWRTMLWVAGVEREGWTPQQIRDLAERWLLRWVRDRYPSTWSAILDSCWADAGGKLQVGAPRGRRRNT